MKNKNLRRISILVSPQTAYNLDKLARMHNSSMGRVVDKLTRDSMLYFKNPVSRPQEDVGAVFEW